MRAAIQGESRLKSMPNNTVIMISFAACSALSLSVTPTDSRCSLAPSVRNLIEETADVLERIGASPNHRNGASVVYGRFLRALIRRAAISYNSQSHWQNILPGGDLQPSAQLGQYGPAPPAAQPESLPSVFLSEPLHFSAMSDGQIIDAINQAGTAFGASVPDVPLDAMDDIMSRDWLDLANSTDFDF